MFHVEHYLGSGNRVRDGELFHVEHSSLLQFVEG